MPSLTADAEDRFGNMYRGERQYAVSRNTEKLSCRGIASTLARLLSKSSRIAMECVE